MKFCYGIKKTILLFLCLVFFSQIVFAQNTDALKKDIYSKLKCCPCKEPFETCLCVEAKEMRAYIEAFLEAGLPKEEIFYKVAKKFSLKVIVDQKIASQVEKRLIKEAGKKHPQSVIEPTSFDFGKLSKKAGRISKTFTIFNKGNSALIIKSIKTSCPCVTSSLSIDKTKSPYFGAKGSPESWQAEIKPGKTAELELNIDLTSSYIKPGKVVRAVSIVSNDSLYPQLTVLVEAEVSD